MKKWSSVFTPDIDKRQLFDRLKFSMTKSEVLRLAKSFYDIGVNPDELLQFTNHADHSVRFHSVWVLENMLLPYPEALDYYLPSIIKYIPDTNTDSVKRHLAKLAAYGIGRVVKKKASKVFERELWATNLEPLEEACFKWFVDEKTKPAVKAHCLEILYLLSTRQRWIAQELPQIIENQMDFGPPSLKAKGRSILKMLKQLK